MKHVLIAFLFFSPLIVFANIRGGEEQIFLQKKKIKDGHTEYYDPADMPEVYYDRSNQEIILVADGFVSSYDVDIFSTRQSVAMVTRLMSPRSPLTITRSSYPPPIITSMRDTSPTTKNARMGR